MSSFIPALHFDSPSSKLTSEWCEKVINQYYYNGSNKRLLADKKKDEIEKFSVGEFDMAPFKKIFKSLKKKHNAPNVLNQNVEEKDLDWSCLPLIPTKLNSAVSIVQKIPVEITCTAIDPLASKKKQEDLEFLKNKPALELDLQELADQLGVPKVDLGTTQHSAIPFSDSPYGLDLNEPDEYEIFVDLLYSLGVEVAFETSLQAFYEFKNILHIKGLEIRDQFKWGVSVNRFFQSETTGLPDAEYVYPDNVECPDSQLPDFSDNTHRLIHASLTPIEMMNHFGITKEFMDEMLNDKDNGYFARNKFNSIDQKNWTTYKINVALVEVKSIDWIGIVDKPKSKKNFRYFTTDENKATSKMYAQNTYSFWWLKNTKHFFDIKRLGWAHRTKGQETFQNFSSNIWRSQKKSAVELCIGENKKAQIAEIKLQHAILKSLPEGRYINIAAFRRAMQGLKETNAEITMKELINMAFEDNIVLDDTEQYDSPSQGQPMNPVQRQFGGLSKEATQGYIDIIMRANLNISNYTGINEQLTGQSANPEGLIGMQKLLINSSLNALYYTNEAISEQYQKGFNTWAYIVQSGIEAGGKTRKAIEAIVGAKKAGILDRLDEAPLHTIGTKVSITQREEERQKFKDQLQLLKLRGVITTGDEYLLTNISNPKDAYALLAIKEKQWLKREERKQMQNWQQQQAIIDKQGENQMQAIGAETEADIKKIYAKGDVQANIIRVAQELGLQGKQVDALIKRALQQDRNDAQLNKSLTTLDRKQALDQQAATV